MSQNKKKFFGGHKEQPEQDLAQTQAIPPIGEEDKPVEPVPSEPDVSSAEPAVDTEEQPKRNKYADKMNRSRHKLSKGVRIAIAAGVVVLLIGGGIWAVMKSRDTGKDDQMQTTAMDIR